MKITGEGGGGGVFLKEWTSPQQTRVLVIKLRWQTPIFLFWLLGVWRELEGLERLGGTRGTRRD